MMRTRVYLVPLTLEHLTDGSGYGSSANGHGKQDVQADKAIPYPVLSAVRSDDGKKTVCEWTVRGLPQVHVKEVLLPVVPKQGSRAGQGNDKRIPISGTKAHQTAMRTLWICKELANAPQGSGCQQQPLDELADALRQLSQQAPLVGTQGEWRLTAETECWALSMSEHLTAARGSGLWPVANARDWKDSINGTAPPSRQNPAAQTLGQRVSAMWPTPTKPSPTGGGGGLSGGSGARGQMPDVPERQALTNGTGQLNAAWVCWLMGWPAGWDAVEPVERLEFLTWDVDPADLEPPPMLGTPRKTQAIRTPAFIRKGLSPEEYITTVPAGTGPIPRVARDIPERVARLKALGNGQVPQCAAVAWIVLTTEV
jgi:hypothetical protein